MLSARDLHKTYQVGQRRVEALRGIDLNIPAGQFITILGRSGSGKSTLLSLLGGLSEPSRGEVRWSDQSLREMTPQQRAGKFGYMFQFSGLLPTLTALENALLPARLAGRQEHARAVAWLTQLGLGERLWALPNELSGGEQRRVAAVRALIHGPEMVLADEPTGDLDPESESQVISFLRQHSPTLILVTHNPELARGSHQLFSMEEGGLRALETTAATPPPPASLELPETPNARRPAPTLHPFWWAVLTLLMAGILGADLITTARQKAALASRQQARKQLERAAMFHLRADVGEVERLTGGRYRVRIALQNPYPEDPLYLMPPELTAYVQVGFNWIEVPLQAEGPQAVRKIVGEQSLSYLLQPRLDGFEQVMPGYMHVRFSGALRLSLRPQPDSDGVARRSDNYYIYLQPPGADAKKLARLNNFREAAPLWISMPPH